MYSSEIILATGFPLKSHPRCPIITRKDSVSTKTKKIRVTCKGATTLRLGEVREFQGGLKSLHKEEYEKLRRSLLRYGFSYPLFVWRSRGRNLCLDGHQRVRVLAKLAEEGYAIPPLPVDYVEAGSEKEAREKVLLLSSQYGKMADESLYAYFSEGGLDFPDLKEVLELPQIDLGKFEKGWMSDPNFQPGSENEQGRLDEKAKVKCPECGAEFTPRA
ncbi:MAG: hypothetical protein ACE5JU_10005 [Candidatus Binatia bacterium]